MAAHRRSPKGFNGRSPKGFLRKLGWLQEMQLFIAPQEISYIWQTNLLLCIHIQGTLQQIQVKNSQRTPWMKLSNGITHQITNKLANLCLIDSSDIVSYNLPMMKFLETSIILVLGCKNANKVTETMKTLDQGKSVDQRFSSLTQQNH